MNLDTHLIFKHLFRYDRKDGVPRQIRNNVITEHDFDINDAVVAVAKEIGRTPSQVLINWTLLIPGKFHINGNYLCCKNFVLYLFYAVDKNVKYHEVFTKVYNI